MKKCIVIGGGIGGVLSARIMELAEREVLLLEAGSSLGGCAGTFEREGLKYNIGATTIPALISDFPLKRLLDLINNSPLELGEVYLTEPSIIVYTGKRKIRRFLSLEESVEEWKKAFPELKNHGLFLKLSYNLTHYLLKKRIYFNCKNLSGKLKTILKNFSTILTLRSLYFKPAKTFLREIYGSELSKDFLDFLSAQLKITLQTELDETSALGLLLGIGYPFTGVGKAKKGMKTFIEAIALPTNYILREKVIKIKKIKNGYYVKTDDEEFFSDEIVLAFPFLEQLNIFEDNAIRNYLEKFYPLLTPHSAFVIYGEYIGNNISPDSSHLIILPKSYENPYISKYVFLSLLECEKKKTFTISTHTPVKIWKENPTKTNILRKNLEELLIRAVSEVIGEPKKHFINIFSATPHTFKRYVYKYHLGGIPFSRHNGPFNIPGNISPFKGLYIAGESSFSYQGWLGISIGVLNLYENVKWIR